MIEDYEMLESVLVNSTSHFVFAETMMLAAITYIDSILEGIDKNFYIENLSQYDKEKIYTLQEKLKKFTKISDDAIKEIAEFDDCFCKIFDVIKKKKQEI